VLFARNQFRRLVERRDCKGDLVITVVNGGEGSAALIAKSAPGLLRRSKQGWFAARARPGNALKRKLDPGYSRRARPGLAHAARAKVWKCRLARHCKPDVAAQAPARICVRFPGHVLQSPADQCVHARSRFVLKSICERGLWHCAAVIDVFDASCHLSGFVSKSILNCMWNANKDIIPFVKSET